MNSVKGQFPVAWKNIERFNKRLPLKLDREQHGLAKKFRKPRNTDPFQSLAALYDYLDRFMSYAVGFMACAKGCSYCCHSEIGLSQIEADYIAARTGILAKRIRRQDSTSAGAAPWVDPNRPCPFLNHGACTIYGFRPMLCRTHVNFDATNGLCRFDSEAESILLLDRGSCLPGAMKAYGELAARYGGGIGDIRDFFGTTSVAAHVQHLELGDDKRT